MRMNFGLREWVAIVVLISGLIGQWFTTRAQLDTLIDNQRLTNARLEAHLMLPGHGVATTEIDELARRISGIEAKLSSLDDIHRTLGRIEGQLNGDH